jgi:hypothetical protein
MKFTAHIVIERPLEKVFLWMLQPHHIVQLVTRDPNKDIISNGAIPPEFIERVSSTLWQFRERAETEIEIKNLSTPTLHVGTTIEYIRGVRNRSDKEWRWSSPATSGSITITKFVPSTFFAFTTKGFSPPAEHRLAFQAQQERTTITYTHSIHFGKIQFMLVSALPSSSYISTNQVVPIINEAIPFGNELVRQQLLHLKTQMEVEID